jgi:hypothetical protein
MGSSKKQTVGYRYSMGLHMGICLEPDALLEIRAGDRLVWVGNVSQNVSMALRAPKLFGGDEREGGIQGTLDVMMGRPDQMPNAYLTSKQGGFQPGYRGWLGLVYRGLITSNNPYIKNWEVRVRSILKGWHNEDVWYPARATIPLLPAENVAFYFALDSSGSMLTVTSNGQTRFQNMKDAIGFSLDFIANSLIPQGARVDLCVVSWGSYPNGYTTNVKLNATLTDVNALKAWIQALGTSYATYFPAGTAYAPTFFNSVPPGSRRVGFFITDGEPDDGGASGLSPSGMAQAARNTVNSVDGLAMHGINIDLVNTTYTSMVDNVDGEAAVVAGGDPQALVTVIAGIFSGRLGMNPVHILIQALTDPDWGMGYPRELIDEESFEAAANTLYSEGFGMAIKWVNQSSVKAFTQIIADHASMNYGQSRTTGKFEIQMLRQDYNIDDLPVFTKKDCRVVKYQRPAMTDTVNEIIVEYVDVATGKEASTAPLQNLANIMAQGRIVSQKLSFAGLPTNSLATRVAQRELQSRSSPVWKMTLEMHRGKATRLKSGKPFVLDMLDTPLGIRVVLRAVEINHGTTVDAMITADCIEDVFGMPETSYVGEPTEPPEPPDTTPQPAVGAVFEVPYRELLQNLGAAAVATLPLDAGFVGGMAMRPGGVPLNFSLYTRIPPGDYTEAGQGDFTPVATISEEIPKQEAITVLAYSASSSLDQVEIGDAAWLGTGRDAELVRIDAIDTAAGTITIGRGCADTLPMAWPANTRLWAFDDFSTGDPEQYIAGETVNAKVVTNATGGQQDIATAPPFSVTMDSRAARPYPAQQLRLNGQATPDEVAGVVTLTWVHRDRIVQADTLIDASASSIGPEVGVTYDVEIRRIPSGILVASQTAVDGGTCAFPASSFDGSGLMVATVWSVRDGLRSYMAPGIQFSYLAPQGDMSFESPYTPPVPPNVDLQFTVPEE